MAMILQKKIPFDISKKKVLPAINALDPAQWLIIDEAYAAQMAERDKLITENRSAVIALHDGALKAAIELLDFALDFLPRLKGFTRENGQVTCPDGRCVKLKRSDPLATVGRIFQDDFCIMQKWGNEYVLTGAVLCFPASWCLSEKFLLPLTTIHHTVPQYNNNISKRVQRLFDGIKPNRPLWRFNALYYDQPELFQPCSHNNPRAVLNEDQGDFIRSERQTLLRLPETYAVVFSIHTFVIKNK